MHGLAENFAQMGEEARLASITELMTFSRQGAERIDSLITRFDGVRQRAQDQGAMVMSVQGISWLLLRACGVSDSQLINLLQPTMGLFPATQEQYNAMCTALRRMGHIIEHHPGNIASSLRGGGHHAPTFFTETGDAEQHHAWGNTSSQSSWNQPSAGTSGYDWNNQGAYSPVENAYPNFDDAESGNGTDTDTCSSIYDTDYQLPADIPAGASQAQIAQSLFWAYQHAKGHWRRFMNKLVRAVRSVMRR